jgi:Ca2+-binding EF-hand superfamily protein
MLAMFMKGDADGDGNLTREELPASFQPRMAQLDLNSDGVLDPAELKKMMQEFQKRREGSREEARDPILYGVAVADGTIVIRTGTRLYAVGNSTSKVKE